MIAASATLDFVVVVIPPSFFSYIASNSCMNSNNSNNNNNKKEKERKKERERKRKRKIINNVFPSFLPPKPKSFRLMLFCAAATAAAFVPTEQTIATAIWTVCLSSIINIRAWMAWMRGGREFDGNGWRRLF